MRDFFSYDEPAALSLDPGADAIHRLIVWHKWLSKPRRKLRFKERREVAMELHKKLYTALAQYVSRLRAFLPFSPADNFPEKIYKHSKRSAAKASSSPLRSRLSAESLNHLKNGNCSLTVAIHFPR